MKYITKKGNRVYKRNPSAKNWSLKITRENKATYFNLGKDINIAKAMADEIDAYLVFNSVDETVLKYNPNKRKGKAASVPAPDDRICPNLGDIVDFLEINKNLIGIEHRTFQCYRRGLYRVTGLPDKEARALPLKKLTKKMLREVKADSVRGIVDKVTLQEKKRSYNTLLRNAKSVFSETAMAYYPENWSFEGLSFLRKEIFFNRVKKEYTLPATSLIEDTFKLMNEVDGDHFVIMALGLHFGMRRKEIFYARRNWFDIDTDRCAVCIQAEGKFKPKNGLDGYTAGDANWGSKILEKSEGFDFLVTDRARIAEKTFKKVTDSLRDIGWTRQSPLHELRKLYGSYLATTKGLYVAQSYLRHTSPQVTSQYYAKLMPSKDMLALWVA
jgi:integrase